MKMRVWLVMRVVAEWAELVVVGCWVWTRCGRKMVHRMGVAWERRLEDRHVQFVCSGGRVLDR